MGDRHGRTLDTSRAHGIEQNLGNVATRRSVPAKNGKCWCTRATRGGGRCGGCIAPSRPPGKSEGHDCCIRPFFRTLGGARYGGWSRSAKARSRRALTRRRFPLSRTDDPSTWRFTPQHPIRRDPTRGDGDPPRASRAARGIAYDDASRRSRYTPTWRCAGAIT